MHRTPSRLVNALGALGYLLIIAQWLWLIMLLMPWLLSLDTIVQTTAPVRETTLQPNPSSSWLGLGILITIIVFAITLYLLSKLPRTVTKHSAHVVHTTTEAVVPILLPKKKVSKKQRAELSAHVVFGLKILLTIVPFFALYGATMTRPPLSEYIIAVVGFFLLCMSLFFVVLQRIVAHVKKIDYSISL